ncbi:HlyD family efflux transporter periplasmic adaptor subunit [Limnohabitans sp.]|jgi:adhesin transport system membrane fusion protein|uniref:HlyD family efflux transporter periplasmic adaptor subunit n=1 Tax=Limnohabitans sp. TaxID=1907725 RepID=UPI003120511C
MSTISKSKIGMMTVEDDERQASQILIRAIGIALILALAWAAFFELDEITVGQGKVIPTSREQIIQSLDSGVLNELLVREGSVVEKGDVLIRIDSARSGAVYREAREKYMGLLALSSRLKAEAYNLPLQFPDEIKAEKDLIRQETQAYEARRRALQESLRALDISISATMRELALTAPMVEKGVMSEVELLRLRRQQSELMGQRADRQNRYITDANNELVRVNTELSQTKENASAREDAYLRTTITSPMKGVVKNVQITTVGGVIQAGQPIMEIVPTDDEMLVEAYVKPADVAFVKQGQEAVVKLTAYDFNKYGGLDGVVEFISPDTLRNEKDRRPGVPAELQEGLYRILVRIKNAGQVRHGQALTPTPGMTASVEIKTGQKTVLEYIFHPLQSVTTALRER